MPSSPPLLAATFFIDFAEFIQTSRKTKKAVIQYFLDDGLDDLNWPVVTQGETEVGLEAEDWIRENRG
jgi:hypothetical protein